MRHDPLCPAGDMDTSRVKCWRCSLIVKARADERQRILADATNAVKSPTLGVQKVLKVIAGETS